MPRTWTKKRYKSSQAFESEIIAELMKLRQEDVVKRSQWYQEQRLEAIGVTVHSAWKKLQSPMLPGKLFSYVSVMVANAYDKGYFARVKAINDIFDNLDRHLEEFNVEIERGAKSVRKQLERLTRWEKRPKRKVRAK